MFEKSKKKEKDFVENVTFMSNMSRTLQEYTLLTGNSPLPPIFALGYHQSRWDYKSTKEIRDIIANLDKNEEFKKAHPNKHSDQFQQKLKRLPAILQPTEEGLTKEHRQIYQDLAELALSPAQITVFEKPVEKNIKSVEKIELVLTFMILCLLPVNSAG